ncbi:hypothetical protein [Melghirimyces algeriensis]|nr:hypothetical protein [Melghirimyces algeriensis]
MSCPRRNILKNGGFRHHLSPWKGRKIRLVPNPVRKGDTSVEMKNGGLLYQNITGPFNSDCSYILFFKIFNNKQTPKPPQVFATVTSMDRAKRLLRTTPVLVEPPYPQVPHFTSYFTIIPPPPVAAKYLSVSFMVRGGSVLVDYISVSAREVGKLDSVS